MLSPAAWPAARAARVRAAPAGRTRTRCRSATRPSRPGTGRRVEHGQRTDDEHAGQLDRAADQGQRPTTPAAADQADRRDQVDDRGRGREQVGQRRPVEVGRDLDRGARTGRQREQRVQPDQYPPRPAVDRSCRGGQRSGQPDLGEPQHQHRGDDRAGRRRSPTPSGWAPSGPAPPRRAGTARSRSGSRRTWSARPAGRRGPARPPRARSAPGPPPRRRPSATSSARPMNRSRAARTRHQPPTSSDATMMPTASPFSTPESLAGGAPAPGGSHVITTVDYHTAGEPFRIVTGGAPDIPGATVLDRRDAAAAGPADDSGPALQRAARATPTCTAASWSRREPAGAPGRAVLAQGRLLHRLRARHDRARRVRGRRRSGGGAGRRRGRRGHRRAQRPGHRPGRARAAAVPGRSPFATSRPSFWSARYG